MNRFNQVIKNAHPQGFADGIHMVIGSDENDAPLIMRVDGVADQIAKNVAGIDESKLKKEVVQKAKEQIAEKFDDKLDDLLEEFNGNLQNVGKIYKSIARSFSKEDI